MSPMRSCFLAMVKGGPITVTQAQGFGDRDNGVRKTLAEALYQRRGEHVRNARRQADDHAAARARVEVAQVLAGALGELEQRARVDEESEARFGGDHAPARAGEQALAKLGLEEADLPAERGLGEVELGSRVRKAARLHDPHQVREMGQVHRAL